MANKRISIPYDVWECIRCRFCDYKRDAVDGYITNILLDYIRSEHWGKTCDTAALERVLDNHNIKPVGDKKDVIIY